MLAFLSALFVAAGPWAADFARTYDDITQVFAGLAADHPELVAKTHLATTAEGRELAVYTIGNAAAPGRVMLVCNHHGDEQWVAQLCVDFSRYLVWANGQDALVTDVLARAAIDVLPLGNPDGFAHGTRMTASGNNIYRNFPYKWGYQEAGTVNDRPGPYAASEPETRALMDHQTSFAGHWIATLNYHLREPGSDGQNYILLPWAYTKKLTLTDAEMTSFRPFLPAPGEAPTFAVDTVPNVFYPAPGTHTDWAWHELASPGFTMELGHSYELPARATYVAQFLEAENLPVFRAFLRGVQRSLDGAGR